MNNRRIAVMASGKGSNLQVILDAIKAGTCPAQVELVICNKEDAGALKIARDAGVPHVMYVDPKEYDGRENYDAACTKLIQEANCQWIVLAGYMRILSAAFIHAFPNQIINIHPSLLPAFVGGDAVGDALKHGVKVAGCTVHLVCEALDSGPILAQATVPVLDGDDWDSLHQRIQIEEHKIYPQTITRLIESGFKLEGRVANWL
ncbi:MAG: phosphoribosylglycinamide formyltransferase [Ghiorsea sp.]